MERVKRALKDIDCYLIVANSRGINVWCAAAGGRFTAYDVINALKSTRIDKLVDHRDIILPQLAAVGIEAKIIKEETGWNVIWGPVYAKDLPAFIKGGFQKTEEMREVKFSFMQRMEMAIAWAFPISIIVALTAFLLKSSILPLIALAWTTPILTLAIFPLYSRWLTRGVVGFIVTTLIPWSILSLGLIICYISVERITLIELFKFIMISLAFILTLSIDLAGITPTYRSAMFERLKVIINNSKCSGCGICIDVCPRGCFELNKERGIVNIKEQEKCIQCGACIIQCPQDALSFKRLNGEIIPPEVIRRYGLNFTGKRTIRI